MISSFDSHDSQIWRVGTRGWRIRDVGSCQPALSRLGARHGKRTSWATDGHKWLNVPFDCGYSFVAEREAHRASMSYQASYLSHQSEARDPLDWNPEFSRRGRGFASYAALRELGRNGVQEMVERNCDCATLIVDGLAQIEHVDVLERQSSIRRRRFP